MQYLMAGTDTPDSLEEKPSESKPDTNDGHGHHHSFHHHAHKAHRLLHMIHPTNGTHIHIVHHPHEVEKKCREITQSQKPNETEKHEVVIYGSPEHIACIQDIKEYHLERRTTLREKNAELFEEFDELHDMLDHLHAEMDALTERAVALDASFDKFGYSAHLRTKDDLESASIRSGSNGTNTSAESRHKDRSVDPLRFWRTPEIRQYFHKGLLWRSARSGEVGSFELFTDLIYVGVIDYVGEVAVANASGESFLHFVILFSLAYKIWTDLTVTINWFEVDDVVGRFLVLFILCCLYGFNCNIEYFFDITNTAGTAFYLTQRMFLLATYVATAWLVPMIRGSLLAQVVIGLVACAVYVASIHVEYPYKIAPLFVAIFIDYFGSTFVVIAMRYITSNKDRSPLMRRISSGFDFLPAMNIEHRVERTSAFTTLVFGYSILRALFQSRAHIGVNAFLGKGMLVIIQAFTIMWIYFDIDAWGIHVHAIRRARNSSLIWVSSHLPLSGGFVLAAATLSELVLAHDCANSNVDDLSLVNEEDSFAEIEQPLRWFYCGGLAVTLLFMTIINFCHIHKKIAKPKISKRARLVFRLCVAVVLACLPAAGNKLNSLDLISITTALFVIVLTVDITGNACETHKFWTGGIGRCPNTRCQYSARVKMCKKKREELRKRMLAGGNVTLQDALRRRLSHDSSQETLVDADEAKNWQCAAL